MSCTLRVCCCRESGPDAYSQGRQQLTPSRSPPMDPRQQQQQQQRQQLAITASALQQQQQPSPQPAKEAKPARKVCWAKPCITMCRGVGLKGRVVVLSQVALQRAACCLNNKVCWVAITLRMCCLHFSVVFSSTPRGSEQNCVAGCCVCPCCPAEHMGAVQVLVLVRVCGQHACSSMRGTRFWPWKGSSSQAGTAQHSTAWDRSAAWIGHHHVPWGFSTSAKASRTSQLMNGRLLLLQQVPARSWHMNV